MTLCITKTEYRECEASPDFLVEDELFKLLMLESSEYRVKLLESINKDKAYVGRLGDKKEGYYINNEDKEFDENVLNTLTTVKEFGYYGKLK